MGFSSGLEKLLIKLGKDNKPTFVAVGVAVAKGIFRPIFTMSDKKQDKETKKYTAIREGLTELIAIPVYIGSGKFGVTMANKLAKPKDMTKDVYKKVVDGFSFSEPEMISKAKSIRKNLFKMRTTLSMFGVFASAFLIIPGLCSATIKPIMNFLQQKNKKQDTIKPNLQINPYNQINKRDKHSKVFNNFYNLTSYEMKVGSV